MSNLLITINDIQYTAQFGETILDVAQRAGIKIPTLCHDPRLEPYSSCFICVVEVEGAKTLQTACSTKVTDNMVVKTDNERVRKSRKTALDLLLSNHYADCAAPCKTSCPAGVDVQGYISLIEKGLYSEAVALIKEVNPLPAICGRVCVRPCEAACNRNFMDEGTPVGIDYMKRFASDMDLESENHFKPIVEASTGKNVAIIGAGPGGLSAAYFLQQKGHQVDIFEANNHAGGWLRYGIPEYRLPNDLIDKEVATITELGTNIFYNKKFGKVILYKDIIEKYDSMILTIGSQIGTLLGTKGEEADGVFSGIDFLRNMEQTGQHYDFKGKTVAVVGGGNTAMDCCRTSIRCNADKVYVVYRRTEAEMPANPIEIHESKLEGVEYLFLTNPVKVNANSEGKLKSMTLQRMALGEPDASGRRRPMPVEGADFDIEVDYILAAIGQKTDAEFINNINETTKEGELKLTRWGDIEANPKTLQTGIPSIFAAGDGVTGPATIIEAIAQAGIAARSCHQYLTKQKVEPAEKEFISKKSNFKTLTVKDFKSKFATQEREEMPVLEVKDRFNFNEVELGYDEDMALEETARCLECGCTEYFSCDLKNYSTEYKVEQKKYAGVYTEHNTDFSHPYIEIDNNKCILCSRCVRICSEVVGASALGLVDRGFGTYVVPSMGKSLTETACESCGLCISTCPTGAITENAKFKPGPVRLKSVETISNLTSSGEAIKLNHHAGFVMKVTGAEGKINKDANISRQSKFGYQYLNFNSRITAPLKKSDDGGFEEITFEEAYKIIKDKITSVRPNENAFFAGARLTNEEQYLIKKLATDVVKTNNIGSFHYLGRGNGYARNSYKNVPFEQIKDASRIYIFGSELAYDHGLVSYMVSSARSQKAIPIEIISVIKNASEHKADKVLKIKSYYWFVKAVNTYISQNNLQNQLYINDNCLEFDEYKKSLTEYALYVEQSGVSIQIIEEFAKSFNNEMNAVLIFSEKQISSNCSNELYNLAMITGKLGKTASGLISLKENNNSHGLFDNNCYSADLYTNLKEGKIKNAFIFGEDPAGCAKDETETERIFEEIQFVCVQDNFVTLTALEADLILPASFHIESGGSFTNTQRVLQNFDQVFEPKVERLSYEQLLDIQALFGNKDLITLEDIFLEAAEHLPKYPEKLTFTISNEDNKNRMFDYGCDYLIKSFEEEFEAEF